MSAASRDEPSLPWQVSLRDRLRWGFAPLPQRSGALAEGHGRHEDDGCARELLCAHAEIRIVREGHHYRSRRLLQIGGETAVVWRAEQGRAHEALRARAQDHGAHPRIVEPFAGL